MTEISPVRAGIIGAGRIGRQHARLLDAATGVTIAAVCDSDLPIALAISSPRGARAYEHRNEMLEAETLDAVWWVCTPPLGHAEPAITALERGIHVYLEKPIARTLTDARWIVAAATCSEAMCVVGDSDASLALDLGPKEFCLSGVIAGHPHVADSSDPSTRSVTRFVEITREPDRCGVFSSPADALGTLEMALACDRALNERRTVPVRAAQAPDPIVGSDVTN